WRAAAGHGGDPPDGILHWPGLRHLCGRGGCRDRRRGTVRSLDRPVRARGPLDGVCVRSRPAPARPRRARRPGACQGHKQPRCGGWCPTSDARRSPMKPRGLPDPSDPTAVRLPPQNLEAERAVLGAILLDNQALYKTLEVISPDEFYLPKHRKIFEAMIALAEHNQVIDLVTLSDHLQHAGALEVIGGNAYLTDLAQAVATAASVTYHAKLIHETGINRILINVATEIVTRGYEGTKRVDELLDYAEKNIFGIAERRLKRSFSPMNDVVNSTVEHINKLYEQKEKITGIPTGFTDLDDMT